MAVTDYHEVRAILRARAALGLPVGLKYRYHRNLAGYVHERGGMLWIREGSRNAKLVHVDVYEIWDVRKHRLIWRPSRYGPWMSSLAYLS